jgi:hypothetical protein
MKDELVRVANVQSREAFCKARKFCAKAGKFFTKARKFPAEFDVFRFKRFMLEPSFDVNQSLQVKPDGLHNFFAFGSDLQNRDHVMLLDKLASFDVKLPSIRRILLSLVDDHVKHESDHVKLPLELPCSGAITSNFRWNFLARVRSRQTSDETSLLRHDHVKLCVELPCADAIKL